MNIPLLDIAKQNNYLLTQFEDAALKVIRSGQFINGPAVLEFEDNCCKLLGVKHAIGVSSGTDALLVSLMALGIGPGDEVICPSFTFFATAGAIARLGATPVFIDIEEHTFNLNSELLESLITDKTRAIIPVHLFGRTVELDKVLQIAKDYGLHIIEDCAQSFNSSFKNGTKTGSVGTVGCFSFFPSKNLGGFGDAGLVTCDSDELAARIKSLRNHGSEVRYYHNHVGANFRIDTIQAALLNVKLSILPFDEDQRLKNAEFYSSVLSGLKGIQLPGFLNDRTHVYNQFTLLIKDGKRDLFQQKLIQNGIGCCIYYPVPLHDQVCFAHLAKQDLVVTDMVVKECISIPIGPELTQDDLDFVSNTILKIQEEIFG